MTRMLFTCVLLGISLAGFVGLAAPVVAVAAVQPASEQPAVPEGFEPVSNVRGPQEHLPAAPLLIAAYAVAWVTILAYLWSLWRRLAKVEKEILDVTRRIADSRRG